MSNCKYCGEPTTGCILVWGSGSIDICGKEDCRAKAHAENPEI